MNRDAPNEYLRHAVLTAPPEQLQLMLYDGAIRFAEQARAALVRRDFDTSCEKLIRAQNIVVEMRNSLRHEVNPSLCERMAALYDFIYGRLVDANIRHRPDAIDDALKVLNHQRETWRMLLDKLRSQAKEFSAEAEDPVAAEPRATLSIHG